MPKRRRSWSVEDNIVKKNHFLIGDETEIYIENLLRQKGIDQVKRIGYTGNKYDIIYRFYGDMYRCLQVKTLICKSHENDTWVVNFGTQTYEDDTLIVLVNEHKTRFCLMFFEELSSSSLYLSFKKNYKYNLYTDEQTFISELFNKSRKSTLYYENIGYSPNISSEMISIGNLEKICNEKGLSFRRNDKNYDVIDCFINSYSIQCKFSSYIQHSSYMFNLRKNLHKSRCIPYDVSDNIDYFIFDLSNTMFLIIPKKILFLRGYLSGKKKNGRTSIFLSSRQDKWFSRYINCFDELQK